MLNYKPKTLDAVLETLQVLDDDLRPRGYRGYCPVHGDEGSDRPSLIVDIFVDAAGTPSDPKIKIMCEGGRPECNRDAILAARGLTPFDLVSPSYMGQTIRGTRGNSHRAPVELSDRQTADGRAFQSSFRLATTASQEVIERLQSEYGITRDMYTDAENALHYGIGLASDDWFMITARNSQGEVAYQQKRNPAPEATGPRWLAVERNPGKNTDNERKWDGVGFVGARKKDGIVVLTEGPSDGTTVAGLDTYDVAAFRGSSAASRIDEIKSDLAERTVVIVQDNDGAGKGATSRLVKSLSPVAKVLKVAVPNEADVRDMYKTDPGTFAERFAEMIDNAPVVNAVEAVDFDYGEFQRGTDVARAEAIAAWIRSQGYDVASTPGHGWLFYDGTVWSRDPAGLTILQQMNRLGTWLFAKARHHQANALREMAERVSNGEDETKEKTESEKKADFYKKSAAGFEHSSLRSRILDTLPSLYGVAMKTNDFDADNHLLGVANGVVDLRTGRLRDMTSRDRITRRIDVVYNPDASAPQWEAFLKSALVTVDGAPDAGYARYLQEVVGYGITGESNRPARYYMLYGAGGNGKSVFTGTIGHVFSAITEYTSFDTFGPDSTPQIRAARADLIGARLVFTGETSAGQKFGEFAKNYTGDKTVTANHMRGENFAYTPHGLVFTATNHKPKADASDGGIWRRVRLLPWNLKLSEKDYDLSLEGRLLAEAEGILKWAVDGAMDYYAQEAPLTNEPVIVSEGTSNYRTDENPLAEFIASNVIPTGEKQHMIPERAIWERWKEWEEIMGIEPRYRMSLRGFKDKISTEINLGPLKGKTGGNATVGDTPRRWSGRLLRPAEEVNQEFGIMGFEKFTDPQQIAHFDGRNGLRTTLDTGERAPVVEAPSASEVQRMVAGRSIFDS